MRSVMAVIACLLVAPVVGATVLLPAEFREIAGGSDIIAHGRVVDVRAGWAEGRRRIDSVVTIEVMTYFKGGAAPRVAFTVPGGEIGRYRSVMVGAPSFQPGDEAVLFLTAGEPLPQVFGLNQGVFRVRQDRTSGRRVVVPPPMAASRTAPPGTRRGVAQRRPVGLDVFGAELRSVLASQRSGR